MPALRYADRSVRATPQLQLHGLRCTQDDRQESPKAASSTDYSETTRFYVMDYSSWIAPNLFFFGFQDVTALSHELAETFNDPFGNNATPWWLSVDAFTGGGLCQNDLETGDVIEVLTTLPTYGIPMNGMTYHVQNEALFPWFAFESPSPAHLGAYSFPDEATLTSLSPGPLHAGCKP